MDPNPVLKKLGFSDVDRVVIIHTDDIGMCQASVSAFEDLWESGIISSGATMVPCPWFLEIAQYARKHRDVDLGVHVTLTSEWETYRWGPVSTRDPGSGMIDSQGYFFHSSEEVQEHGNAEAVQVEIRAQIEQAIASGIGVTHIDTHMGTVGSIKFIPSYITLAMKFALPAMIMRLDKDGWMAMGFDEDTANMAFQMISQLEEQGFPLVDRIAGLELDQVDTVEDRMEYAKKVLGNLNPGVTHFIIHPSKDTPELRAITSSWPYRVADYEVFKREDMRRFLQEQGIQVIGYQALKNLI